MEDYYRWVPEWAASRRAARVITVSHAARQRPSSSSGWSLPVGRLTVTYEAADGVYQPVAAPAEQARVRALYGLSGEYLLAIGSADPRKNLATLLQAYARLPATLRQTYPLAIVWTHPFLAASIAEQLQTLALEGQVSFLQRVTAPIWPRLYNAGAAFLFPSRYERLWPAALGRAMACGAPVVAADNSSIPEIVGEAAVLTPTDALEPWIDAAIIQLLNDPVVRAQRRRLGLERAAGFSWARCASETRSRLSIRPRPVKPVRSEPTPAGCRYRPDLSPYYAFSTCPAAHPGSALSPRQRSQGQNLERAEVSGAEPRRSRWCRLCAAIKRPRSRRWSAFAARSTPCR